LSSELEVVEERSPDLAQVELHFLDSLNHALEFREWLGLRRPTDVIALDTEGSGLSPERDHVRLVQFADDRSGWAIPVEDWRGVVADVLRTWHGDIYMHNAKYDVAMLRESQRLTYPRDRIRDTRLMAHVLDSTGSTALKNLTQRYVDPRANLGQQVLHDAMRTSGWTWATVPVDFQPYWAYGALDAVLTYRLGQVLWPRVLADAPVAYEVEAGVSWVTEQMERRGVMVDRPYAASFMGELEAYCAAAVRWCQETYGVRPGQSASVIRILQDEGIQFSKATASGAISLDKEVLSGIDHPLAETVLGHRQAQKVISTYLSTYLELADDDGVIHPSINVIGGFNKTAGEAGGSKGVRTGRMSMDSPNLQNVPTRTRMGAKIRRCIRAREGHTLVMIDFDQIEMRMLGSVARDEAMIKAFRDPGDFFCNLAAQLFNEPNFKKSDPRRQLVKNGGYAKIYGAGVAKFAKTAGIDEVSAKAFLDAFDAAFPGVRRMQREVETLATQRRIAEGVSYVRCPLTNRKHIADPGREYALVNYMIQGAAAVVLKRKMIELDAAGVGEWLVLPVHDEIIADVPTDRVTEYLEVARDVMNDEDVVAVPITATPATGPSWGDKTEVAWPA
jgi:DNA polymerase-1